MNRPILDFADVMYPGLRDKKVSECTPEESIVAGIAWLADNSEYGIDDAARKLIDEFRRFARSESAPIWISVKDRLPTAADAGADGGVLAFIPGIYREARARHYRDVRCWMETEDKIEVGFWMALPKEPA